LNDTTEFSYGTETASEILNELSGELGKEDNELIEKSRHEAQLLNVDNVFICSLTEERDLLSQWRAYTRGGMGYSVGFRSRAISKVTLEDKEFDLVRCLYKRSDQKRALVAAIESAKALAIQNKRQREADELESRKLAAAAGPGQPHRFVLHRQIAPSLYLAWCCQLLAVIFKNPSFAEENEWRLVAVGLKPLQLKYRAGKSMVIPYAEFKFPEASSDLPVIEEVVVGPCPHLEQSCRSTKMLLESQGFSTPVWPSEVPYRSW
jgi:hypothetical protein